VDVQQAQLVYAAVLTLTLMFLGFLIARKHAKPELVATSVLAYGLVSLLSALRLQADIFSFLSLLSIAIFYGGTLLLLWCSFQAWEKYRWFAITMILVCVAVVAVGVDAFLLEPYDLQIRHEVVVSPKVQQAIKVAIVTDIQTDNVGTYEEKAFQKVMAEKPDLILFPGDYIHEADSLRRSQQYRLLKNALIKAGVSARLGMFAVPGNVDASDWPKIFDGLSVNCFTHPDTVDAGEVVVTGLPLDESFSGRYVPAETDKLHIIFGHAPDFALAKPKADLLIAGHTHGGQVQLPFFGPLITFSAVPRQWAAGCCVPLKGSGTLIISRGLGMERRYAPRLRFLCRPEVVFVTIEPANRD
jgi:predicted MPP superfamily phosphohydrolase